MEIAVSIRNVTKKINNKTIIDDISFDVYSGEIFGFLGPNGAGKTTTIRMLVGLMKITSGDIFICGKSIQTNYEEAVQHVGAIVENPEMYKFLSGYDNLKQYARMAKGVTEERIQEIIELVGLKDRIKDKVKTYSLGMRQRLGLAQALLHKPKVLILDEPTNGLDPAGIREIRDYLKRLASQENMAVVVSSHLLSEMEMMCDRIGIIQQGKMIQIQTVKTIIGEEDIQDFSLNVKPQQKVFELISEYFPALEASVTGNAVHVKIKKSEMPELVRQLVSHECDIFEINSVNKTLEDKFLEITGEQGEVSA